MARPLFVPAIALFLFLLPGCLARQVSRDGRGLRTALLEMYTDQAVDNLIRAHSGQPFVQLAYSSLAVQDTDIASSGLAGGSATLGGTESADFSSAPAKLLRAGTFAAKFPFSFRGERDRVLTFHADPVTDKNGIYEAYLAFAGNPSLFVCSECEPEGSVHISRRCGNVWYWIPCEAGEAFLDLVLKTSVAPEKAGPMGYWETTITEVLDETSFGDGTSKTFIYTLQIKDGSLPKDLGSAQIIRSNGCKDWVAVREEKRANPANAAGEKTQDDTKLKLIVQSDRQLTQLKNATVRYFSYNFPNTSPPPDAQQKSQDLLESIRILLTKNGGNT